MTSLIWLLLLVIQVGRGRVLVSPLGNTDMFLRLYEVNNESVVLQGDWKYVFVQPKIAALGIYKIIARLLFCSTLKINKTPYTIPPIPFSLRPSPFFTSLSDFFIPAPSVAVMLVDQRRDLLYLLHISSAAPFSLTPHLFSTFFRFFFLHCPPLFFSVHLRPLIMPPLCLYSPHTSGPHEMGLLIWLNPEQWELQQWTEGREGHRHEYIIYTDTGTVCVLMG